MNQAMTVMDAVILSVLGLAIVFVVLVLLSFIIRLLSSIARALENRGRPAVATAGAPAEAISAAQTVQPVKSESALSSAAPGEARIHGVPPRTAALLMAIVADESGIPPEELRVVSIKQLDD